MHRIHFQRRLRLSGRWKCEIEQINKHSWPICRPEGFIPTSKGSQSRLPGLHKNLGFTQLSQTWKEEAGKRLSTIDGSAPPGGCDTGEKHSQIFFLSRLDSVPASCLSVSLTLHFLPHPHLHISLISGGKKGVRGGWGGRPSCDILLEGDDKRSKSRTLQLICSNYAEWQDVARPRLP